MQPRIKVSRFLIGSGLALLSGIALSAAIAWFQFERNERQINATVQSEADRFAREIISSITTYQYGLRGARGAVLAAGERLDRETFLDYSRTRNIAAEFPGALGFGYVHRVKPADEAGFIAAARKKGWPDYQIRQISPHDGERYLIQYVEPLDRNLAAVGLDLASEPQRKAAAETSMRTGLASLTGPIALVQGPLDGIQSFLLMLPVYRTAIEPTTEQERIEATVGWTYAPLSMREVFAHIPVDPALVQLQLLDVTPGSPPQIFYRTDNAAVESNLVARTEIDHVIFGRQWRISLSVQPQFVARMNQSSPVLVFWTGAVASLMFAALVALSSINRQRQRLIAAEQARLATIVENSSDSIIGESLDGRITSWNRGAVRLFGYQEEEVLGQILADFLIPAEQRHEDAALLGRIAKGEDVPAFRAVRVAKDGSRIDVSIATSAIRDPNGSIVGAAKLMRDIRARVEEERRQADFRQKLEQQVEERTAELRKVNVLLADVLRAASEIAIIATELDGTIRIFNEGASRLLGYSADEVVGKLTPAIIHLPEEIEARGRELTAQFGESITGFRVFVYLPERNGSEAREWTYVRKDGSHVAVSLVATPMHDEKGAITGYLGIAQDITVRRQTMKALEDAKAAADSANSAKSRFLAIMSHELRTPMAGVLGMADLLIESPLNEEQQALLRAQMRSANTLLDLLNDILDFAKIEAGRVEREVMDFSVRDIVGDVVATLSPIASERANSIDVDIAPDVAFAFSGDGKHYRQVLFNLVGNANKFTASGRLTIAVKQLTRDDGKIELTTTVSDTGLGISEEGLSRLFKPFVQEDLSTSRKFGGTGLGLAICKNLVELMGGRIWAQSAKGKGSSFTFTVTVDRGDQARVEKIANERRRNARAGLVGGQPARPLRILLAEDNDTNRMLIMTMLSRSGHTVVGVEHGALAVEQVLARPYDIVLMDMQMPVMDGPTAIKRIRSLETALSGIPIIALTADAIAENQREYMRQGANAVVTKPVNWKQLNLAMDKLISNLAEMPLREAAPPVPVQDRPEPLLDHEMLRELADTLGEPEFLPMIDNFKNSILTLSGDLRASDSGVEAKRTAHAIKGLAAQFGATKLSNLAREIEMDLDSRPASSKNIAAVPQVIRDTLEAFAAWRQKL